MTVFFVNNLTIVAQYLIAWLTSGDPVSASLHMYNVELIMCISTVGGHTVANQPPTTLLSFTFILSPFIITPPPRNGVSSHSRCGTEPWTELELALKIEISNTHIFSVGKWNFRQPPPTRNTADCRGYIPLFRQPLFWQPLFRQSRVDRGVGSWFLGRQANR